MQTAASMTKFAPLHEEADPVRKIIIFGNSGSGKSTLATKISNTGIAHLDLDTLAWLPTTPPERKPLNEAFAKIKSFINEHNEWVVEGCYADLLELLAPHATEAIFMNLPVELCQSNAKNRPWEPHKYASKQEQDSNLAMLLEWIAGYTQRNDVLSYKAHRALYARFDGEKTEVRCNQPHLN